MKRSQLRLYLPFIALAMAQAAFVLFAPSRGESNQNLFAGAGATGSGASASTGAVDPATGAAIDSSTGALIPGTGSGTGTGTGTGTVGGATGTGTGTGAVGGGSTGGGATGTATGGGGTKPGAVAPGTPGQPGTPGAVAAGDTSHCKNGQQTDVIGTGPPCAPKFTGNNGGNVYNGVTDKEIKLVYFECQPNEQVNAILATQGLAASQAETDAMIQATLDFMNKTYEFYGRKITFKHVVGDCPLTPPDPAKSRQAAAEVAKTKPFAVIHYATGPSTHDVWSQNGILSLGGPNLDNVVYAGRRPFHWDVFTSGTEGGDQIAEYYCKKLKGKPASNAGVTIHPTIPGGRNAPRKLALIVPDNGDGATVPNAQEAAKKVKECGGGDPPIFTYSSDINRANEQTDATVAGLIDKKITTVACMCDAIAPVFLTKGMTKNGYFPEHLLPGANLLDYDVLGRLYDNAQWAHAFGPSQLTTPVPFEQSDAPKIWRASGRSGSPCTSCNLVTGYVALLGAMVQSSGPNLNPLNIEKALVGTNYSAGGWAKSKGNNAVYLIKFGPNDYNAISDYREVYWDATATSTIDGKQGAYINMDGGHRYATGELGTDFKVPAKPQ